VYSNWLFIFLKYRVQKMSCTGCDQIRAKFRKYHEILCDNDWIVYFFLRSNLLKFLFEFHCQKSHNKPPKVRQSFKAVSTQKQIGLTFEYIHTLIFSQFSLKRFLQAPQQFFGSHINAKCIDIIYLVRCQ